VGLAGDGLRPEPGLAGFLFGYFAGEVVGIYGCKKAYAYCYDEKG
jgi:hypothetical protein